jgi:hypothetical protein
MPIFDFYEARKHGAPLETRGGTEEGDIRWRRGALTYKSKRRTSKRKGAINGCLQSVRLEGELYVRIIVLVLRGMALTENDRDWRTQGLEGRAGISRLSAGS